MKLFIDDLPKEKVELAQSLNRQIKLINRMILYKLTNMSQKY